MTPAFTRSALNKGIQMKITEFEMRGLLTGKCIPGDMKVNEQLPAYLVRKFSDLHEQLKATTNSLTNAQEALKSAGIEADTVQAGVMELVSRMNTLAAENAKLMSGFSFFMYSDESGFETFKTEAEAIDAANEMIGCCREDAASDGWPEETETIRWGVIRQHAVACEYQKASEENGWMGWCDYKLSPETPATDAYLNAVRAEGADAAAAKIRKAIPAFKDIHCGAVKECADIAEMVAAQFTTGNAGKDGSHE